MLSQLFPTRAMIAQAAQISLQVDSYRARNMAVPQDLLRIHSALEARYARLNPMEQAFVAQTYQKDREQIAVLANRQEAEAKAQSFAQQVDDLTRQLTPGIGGRPNGAGLALASALRNNAVVEVKTRKVPHGEEADARVRAATGMSEQAYFKRMDAAADARNKARNTDMQSWRDYVANNFPGQDFTAVNRLVRDWPMESLKLSMVRRAQADQPDTVKLRASEEDLRRLDLIEAISEVDGSNSDSVMHRGPQARIKEIIEEGYDRDGQPRGGDLGLRRDIARALDAHGAGFDINVGGSGEGTGGDPISEEIVSVSDEE